MTNTEVEAAILSYIAERFAVQAGATEVTASTQLVESGLVDSVGILLLVRFAEEEFGIRIEPDDLVLENFATVEAIRDFVTSRLP
jgi:acyl carrier protein